MKYTVPQVAKAVVAFVIAALTALGTMLADGSIELVEVSGFIGALVAAFGVFEVRNAPVEKPVSSVTPPAATAGGPAPT